jgi:TolB-like protein
VAMLTQPELMDQLFQPFGETIRQVDPSVVKVVVFRETRQDRYPELNTLIENRVTDELIRSNRFKVVECRECRTPRVVSDEKSFSYSNTIESNARLAEIGTRLGVDGVLMWSTMGTGKNVIVNFKMVRANDGAVVWSKHFQTEPDRSAQEEKRRQQEEEARFRDSGFYSYLGMSGFNTTRVSTSDDKTANPDAFEKMGLGVGGILLRNSSFLDNFAYGLEANFTSAAGLNLNSTFGVVTAEPFFLLAIDPLLFKESKNRVFNLYAAVGPTVALGKTPVTLISSKAGLMFKPTPDLFLNVGFVNVPTNTIDLQAKNNFQSTEQFGGFVWDVGMGIVFKP